MKWKILIFFVASCFLTTIVSFVAKKSEKSDFEAAKEIIVMRKIAHQVLQYSGDSTSRILPIKKISKNEFQIPFESAFTFKPDSLVSIIGKIISENKLPTDYIVNVLEENTEKIIFGYAILKSEKNNIVPCKGREQTKMRYCISIKFQEESFFETNQILFISSFCLFGFGLIVLGIQRNKKIKSLLGVAKYEKEILKDNIIQLGKYIFFPDEQSLVFENEKLDLTQKETKLLCIFAAAPNQVIDRNRLQKEVWEDEGIIVGRSLDMFISKLRKKLDHDSDVKIMNIHGKGYKLSIEYS